MAEVQATTYWCQNCSQNFIRVLEGEIKCSLCQRDLVEEIPYWDLVEEIPAPSIHDTELPHYPRSADFGSESPLSLWFSINLGITINPHRRRQFRQSPWYVDGNTGGHDDDGVEEHNAAETSELDREFESIIQRRRNSAAILQMLHDIRGEMTIRSENGVVDMNREREIGRALLFFDLFDDSQNETTFGSLGDYLVGPGLDLLLQHLAENDPNIYGTPPARKEAVEALPTVLIKEKLQCSVCLDDFETGTEVKELPCKHKFHCGCIMPWLEIHSSCPVCRYQLPFEEKKVGAQRESEIESHRAHIHDHSLDEEVDGSVRVPPS